MKSEQDEDFFKKKVVDYVYDGKYAKAYGLLRAKIRSLLTDEVEQYDK